MIEFVARTGSTNADLLARAAQSDARENDWLVADRQVAGRGRQGRAWFDGAGNFMGSTVVAVRPEDPPPHTLALVAGVALHAVIAELLGPGPSALLKWPNDVMIGSAKLAGVLLERSGGTVVIGIGINLTVAPTVEGRETAALSTFCSVPDRDRFAGDLATSFSDELLRWRSLGLAPLIRRWQAAAHAPGTPLLAGEPGEEPLAGEFAGLTDDGALILTLADGTRRIIHAGEVRLGPPQDTER